MAEPAGSKFSYFQLVSVIAHGPEKACGARIVADRGDANRGVPITPGKRRTLNCALPTPPVPRHVFLVHRPRPQDLFGPALGRRLLRRRCGWPRHRASE